MSLPDLPGRGRRSPNRPARRLVVVLSCLAITLGMTAAIPAEVAARPLPPGGSSATMVIVNLSGAPLTLDRSPATDVWSGSSSTDRWIDPPAAWIMPDQTEVVRAWSSNPVHMATHVRYSGGYRSARWQFRMSLDHQFSITTLGNTGATHGDRVVARLDRLGPAMKATYVLY
ncbi:hypothetical protein [Gordonia sp. NPDC058843]|uniref:hypothetical protein n=1 Tax=Gordonia sp. NPDC058843 TaxID=3346648 RepID=UPI00369E1A6E